MILVILAPVILMVALAGVAVHRQIKKTDPNNVDASNSHQVDTTRDFLPYEDIKDNMIDLGMFQYRAIIKCSSINYHLKTDQEKEIIEMSYQRFLNSLSHPISILVQKKESNNTNSLELLQKDIDNTLKTFPGLSQYADVYYRTMDNVLNDIQNNKQTDKYIIVPFNDAVTLTSSTDEEKYEYAMKELRSRCSIIIEGLQGVDIKSNILNTNELIDLVYCAYHKECSSQSESIVSGEFTSLLVEAEDKIFNSTDKTKLDWILYEAQVRINTEIANSGSADKDLQDKSIKIINRIGKIRNILQKGDE
ncbi:MAG: hypothetical protein R3Y64_09195 [Peptostreptococcaceae bacterium]